MSDPKMEKLAISDRAKSIESVPATKSGNPGEPLHTTSVARKSWRFTSLIVLILLGAVGYLLHSGRAGLAAALCAIACGVFLVRQATGLMAEQDKLQEEQPTANQPTVSPSQTNPPDDKQT